MATITEADVDRITSAVYIEAPVRSRSSTKFWGLLVLAGIIATAGLVADSTATVIGAMIVAPLMTPILGVAVGLVLSDRRPLLRSMLLVLLGALAVIAIAYLIALLEHPADAYLGNSQVQARTSPRLIDLIAALATGLVGSFALVRSDISDALPGVAIAISLVPPLAVVGLLLEVQRYADAAQAMLLFATNVTAIIATGTIVLLLYRVRSAAEAHGYPVGKLSGRSLVAVGAMLVVVVVPLAIGSANVARDQQLASTARPIAREWATRAGWEATAVEAVGGAVIVTALGPPPQLDPDSLRVALNEAGLSAAPLTLRLVVGGTAFCEAGGTTCVRQASTP